MLNIITSLILVLSINQPFFAQRKGSKIKQLPKCPNLSKTILNETEENNKKVVQIPLYELEETNLIASLSAVVFIFFRIIEKLPDAFCLLSLLSFIPLIFVQRLINKIHLQYAPGIPINDKFSKSNVAVIIVGGFFIVLALFSFFVPESE